MSDTTTISQEPTVIFVRGIPGSGKSYLATALRRELGEGQVVMLDPDATDYQSREYLEHAQRLTIEGVDPKLHAYRFLRGKAYDAIVAGKVIIWNQPFTNLEIFNTMVGRLQTHASENGRRLSVLIVEVDVDPEVAKMRVAARKAAGGHGPSAGTLAQRIADYRSYADQGYPTVTIHGEADIAASVVAVMQAVAQLRQKV